jgi:hypothetical protein
MRTPKIDASCVISRRSLLQTGSAAAVGALVISVPACGPSKEKAVRVAGFVIDLTKESLPLLNLLGQANIVEIVRVKAIPALEKLKDALASTDIPTSRSLLGTVRNVLGGVETALLNLPASPRVTTIISILASVRVLLLTVEAFVESEMNAPASTAALSAPETGAKMRKVLEAARQ